MSFTKLERSTLRLNCIVRSWSRCPRDVDISTSDSIRCPSCIFYLFDNFNHFSTSFSFRSNRSACKIRSDWRGKARRYNSQDCNQSESYMSHLNTLNSTVLCAVPVLPGPPAVMVGTPVALRVPAREPAEPPN